MTKQKKPRISGEASTVKIDTLVGNAWNPNKQSDFKYAQTRKVIREFGFLDPCTVRSGREKGKLFKKKEIIDGEHRWLAAKDEGLTEVLILDVGRMSDAKAKVLTDIMNNLRGENDPLKWAEMVQSVQEEDSSQLQYLPYQEDELNAMLESTTVDWGAFEGGMNSEGPRDADGDLYKKFSVSVSKATMARAQDVLRKVKAAKGIDSDAAAFEAILDGFEAYVAAQGSNKATVDNPPTRRRRGAKRGSQAA